MRAREARPEKATFDRNKAIKKEKAAQPNPAIKVYDLYKDDKAKEQLKQDKQLMDVMELNHSEFLQHISNQAEFIYRNEIMGQIRKITRKVMDIEDDKNELFDCAGTRYSTPTIGKFSLSLDMHEADGKAKDNTEEKPCKYHDGIQSISSHKIFSLLVQATL